MYARLRHAFLRNYPKIMKLIDKFYFYSFLSLKVYFTYFYLPPMLGHILERKLADEIEQ